MALKLSEILRQEFRWVLHKTNQSVFLIYCHRVTLNRFFWDTGAAL